MARRLHRSHGPAQVTPDVLIGRRKDAPFALDEPVSAAKREGRELYYLNPGKGRKSVLDQIQISLSLPSETRKVSEPRLTYDHALYTVTTTGKDSKNKFVSTSLFSKPVKMACPSFSLPAGPTYEMGTCPAANQSKSGGLREPGRIYTCDGCYALEGNYIYASMSVAQGARLHFVRRLLRADPTGRQLADTFIAAISDFATSTTLSGGKEGIGARLVLELGVQKGGRLHVPIRLPGVSEVRFIPTSTKLPHSTGFPDTDALRAADGVEDGQVCGFFRIHDSGDFGVLPGTAAWKAYLDAWIWVAEALPGVRFWVPTRMWMWSSLVDRMSKAPRNLVIRPSGLHLGDEAPQIEGLATGSTVYDTETMAGLAADWTGEPDQTWPCPVYSQAKKDDKSCMGVDCRRCWASPEVPVAYRYH